MNFIHFYKIFKLSSVLLFLFCGAVCSQSTVIDSLKIELQNHKTKDTIRINILNYLAFYNYRNNSPEALAYVDEALQLSDELQFVAGKARSVYLKGAVYMEQSNFNEAVKNYQKAIQLYTSLKDLKGLEKCKNALGVLYFYKGEYKLSLQFYEEAIAIAEKSGNKKSIHKYFNNIGNIYSNTGNYQKALEHFNNALEVNRANKDSLGILNNLNSIAILYYDQGNYPLSLDYNNQSLKLAESYNDSIGIFQSLINLGNLYRQQDLNDKALQFYNKALAIESAKFNIKNVTALKNNIAGIYYDKKVYDKAISYYKESIALSKEIEDNINLVSALNGLGYSYLEVKQHSKAIWYFEESRDISILNEYSYDLSDSYDGLAETYYDRKEYNLALLNAQKLVELANAYDFLKHKKNAYALLSKIYKSTGDFKKALESYEKYKIVSDSILNEDNIKKIAQLEYEYKYEKELNAAEKRELKLTKTVETKSKDLEKSQRNLLLGVILFLIIAIVLGSIIFLLKLRNSKAKIQNNITEQKLLRTQMTPHFIFNSLSVLQGMILNKEESKSVNYLSKFSKLLRITLENSRDKTVLLLQELEAVENYLSLQNIENEKINFKLNVAHTIDANSIKVPPMLIQPFVENAIEHAFKNKKEACSIEINLDVVDSKLICIILDNGVGIDSSERNANQNKKSLATKITSERLEYLSKDFKMKGAISIEDRSIFNEQGTKVTIQIPYNIAV